LKQSPHPNLTPLVKPTPLSVTRKDLFQHGGTSVKTHDDNHYLQLSLLAELVISGPLSKRYRLDTKASRNDKKALSNAIIKFQEMNLEYCFKSLFRYKHMFENAANLVPK
jgi:hypothetical protein